MPFTVGQEVEVHIAQYAQFVAVKAGGAKRDGVWVPATITGFQASEPDEDFARINVVLKHTAKAFVGCHPDCIRVGDDREAFHRAAIAQAGRHAQQHPEMVDDYSDADPGL